MRVGIHENLIHMHIKGYELKAPENSEVVEKIASARETNQIIFEGTTHSVSRIKLIPPREHELVDKGGSKAPGPAVDFYIRT